MCVLMHSKWFKMPMVIYHLGKPTDLSATMPPRDIIENLPHSRHPLGILIEDNMEKLKEIGLANRSPNLNNISKESVC